MVEEIKDGLEYLNKDIDVTKLLGGRRELQYRLLHDSEVVKMRETIKSPYVKPRGYIPTIISRLRRLELGRNYSNH